MKVTIILLCLMFTPMAYAKHCTKTLDGNVETKTCVDKNGNVTNRVKVYPSFEQKLAAMNAVKGMYATPPVQVAQPAWPSTTPSATWNPPVTCSSQVIGNQVYTTCR